MEFKNLLTEVKGNIGFIKINRPKVLNALNLETIGELETAVSHVADNSEVKAIVITGTGEKAFVAGADIAAMKDMSTADAKEFAEQGHRCMSLIESCSKPVIAAVNGFALGGGTELSLACDIVLASDTAKFGLPEVKLGIYPGFGGTQRLPRLIGAMRARELIFSGNIIDANQAYEWGIVNHIYPADQLMEEATKLAQIIADNGPVAVSEAKRVVNNGMDKSYSEALEDEKLNFSELFSTKDQKEGMAAFLEKRKPNFPGK